MACFWGIHPCKELLCDMTLFSVWNDLGFWICLFQWTSCLQRSLKRPLCIVVICKNKYLVCSFSFPSSCPFSGNVTCYSSEKRSTKLLDRKLYFGFWLCQDTSLLACWVSYWPFLVKTGLIGNGIWGYSALLWGGNTDINCCFLNFFVFWEIVFNMYTAVDDTINVFSFCISLFWYKIAPKRNFCLWSCRVVYFFLKQQDGVS